MIDLSEFTFNKNILSKIVVLNYNKVCSQTLCVCVCVCVCIACNLELVHRYKSVSKYSVSIDDLKQFP